MIKIIDFLKKQQELYKKELERRWSLFDGEELDLELDVLDKKEAFDLGRFIGVYTFVNMLLDNIEIGEKNVEMGRESKEE